MGDGSGPDARLTHPRPGPAVRPATRFLGAPPDCVAGTFALEDAADFYPGIDVLVVTLPGTGSTEGLVDAHALGLLPEGALLINPARARVVDEAALADALRSGRLAGAAIDAQYREPMPADDPWWDMPNTIVTAHISGSASSTFAQPRIRALAAENLRRFRADEPLLNVIQDADRAS